MADDGPSPASTSISVIHSQTGFDKLITIHSTTFGQPWQTSIHKTADMRPFIDFNFAMNMAI
jgi:hypothetical protein